jgi:hypothetical protein
MIPIFLICVKTVKISYIFQQLGRAKQYGIWIRFTAIDHSHQIKLGMFADLFGSSGKVHLCRIYVQM